MPMEYLHTMVRVADIDASLDFYCNKLGMVQTRRVDNDTYKASLIFLSAPGDTELAAERSAPLLELTYNWEPEEYTGGRNFGHLAFRVDDIYESCPKADGWWCCHQPAAARWADGLRTVARRYLDRTPAAWRCAGTEGALGLDGEYRELVEARSAIERTCP